MSTIQSVDPIPGNRDKIVHFISSAIESLCYFTAAKISQIASSILGKPTPVLNSESAWHENLALMQHASTKTTDLALKDRIRFLGVNYLNKIAPIETASSRIVGWNFFENAFQVSPYFLCHYHRLFARQRPNAGSAINQRFALGDKSPLVLTDTDQFAHFFPLAFVVLNHENKEAWPSLILDAMASKKELLLDLTQNLGPLLLTEKDPEKENIFSDSFDAFKGEIQDLIQSMDNSDDVAKFLKANCVSVARVKFEQANEKIGGIKVLPLFSELSPEKLVSIHPRFTKHFLESTGVTLGALSLRRVAHGIFPLPQHFSIQNDNYDAIRFKSKEAFLNLLTFPSLESHPTKQHVAVLGKSLLQMLQGFLGKIDQQKWDELHQTAATREIFQTVLGRILAQFKEAERSIENDTKFIQAIELAHAELATLLELTLLYIPEDFAPIYLKQLSIIPESLQPYLKGGLGKAAETVLAETLVAARSLNPNLVKVAYQDFYFELSWLIGATEKLEKALEDDQIDHIDLYGCAFNPSIGDKTHYKAQNLIADIEQILKEKPHTKHLTAAIDFTNDYFNSSKAQQLLTHFEEEIHSGRLNVIFLGSGQKFDMLGMDHFYGSPFYMINNGAPHWKPFDNLLSSEVNKTDRLSTQWFCLLYEHAANAIDNFRTLYFQNTRSILNQAPSSLSPLQSRIITVSSIDSQVDPTFIDVKIRGLFHYFKVYLLVAYAYSHATAAKVKLAIRSSFGFLHPNATLIFEKNFTILRLHPGISPSDNRAILNFLHSLV